jgi:phosphoribosylamine--glycine ligase
VVLALLESDLFTIMRAVTEERLDRAEVRFSSGAAACVILASQGYPLAYEKGFEIEMPEDVRPHVLFAGAKEKDGKLYTSGGRVLGVVGTGATLPQALALAYERVEQITFANKFYRHDIGKRALEA